MAVIECVSRCRGSETLQALQVNYQPTLFKLPSYVLRHLFPRSLLRLIRVPVRGEVLQVAPDVHV
ncbi:hypothetical protein E2C01_075298 [Portunus trituberculatus]|uniref:Uncharacterized protein n=1 Tax=Portunus trituberculatus TaxID=210409 RepID=A0A5B7I5R8_PORTR|nr:hypothetical protein [Portunus trituberculatus]